MPIVNLDNVKTFQTPELFATWLEQNHDTKTELWLKIFKKSSKIPTITWGEAVIEGLCWGWIDGVKKSLDDDAYLQRFTPRRQGSNWSKRNTEHVEKLIRDGRMQESGLIHVRLAKANGRWQAAYAPQSEMVIPDDFLAALDGNSKAKQCFETLTRSQKFTISTGLQTAKKPETRLKRFNQFLLMLERNTKPS
ncbi:YdeI/OmpD-associated family protein [Psychrosphaera algicola]|uniref:YdeI/OmpD-associated family protein n=1 Tax=Psychrosphaera algicola TaxID=3023714 RepID=A0ABT5FJQ7_9GAMM|nr:YdeI/OmpD-associated family protein [Psychrosphaera sp. G1-22]MDC2891440.1 YdeI/OmpD-associated family protein [Psychrosphaera sp. G1-22]